MYKIILYNNGKRVKTIRSYQLYTNAIKKYRGLLKDNKTYFPKEYLWNGIKTDYELVLTAPPKNKAMEFFRNEIGAVVKIKTKGDFVIKQITKYTIEDRFKNRIDGKMYDFKLLIKKLLSNQNLTYTIMAINNKLVIERFENDDVDVFVLKNCDIAYSLSEAIRVFNNTNGLTNFIYFQEPTLDTKMRVYDDLELKYGISKDYMQKVTTR
jgi:hypothetical protein